MLSAQAQEFEQIRFVANQGGGEISGGEYTGHISIGEPISSFVYTTDDLTYNFGFFSQNIFEQNEIPVAEAGESQQVGTGAIVILDGTQSYDPDEDELTYLWTAPEGIILSDNTSSTPYFTATEVSEATNYEFELIVSDGQDNSEPDNVTVTIVPGPSWNVVVYTNNCPAIIILTYDDLPPLTTGDLVGAFVGDECRGFATVMEYEDDFYALFNIQTEIAETVTFKVWQANTGITFENEQVPYTIETEPGEDLGSFDNPLPVNVILTVDIEQNSNNIEIYPNPTSGIINFDFSNINIDKILITDVTGKIIIEKINFQQSETINLSSYANGIYFIKLDNQNNIYIQKIIKN